MSMCEMFGLKENPSSQLWVLRECHGPLCFAYQGTLNSNLFTSDVQQVLAPDMKPGDRLILDNLSAHQVKGAL